MIIIIICFITAGVFFGSLLEAIEYGDKWDRIFYLIMFLLFFVFGIYCFKTAPRTYPAAKYEISSKVTTKNVDTYERGGHFTHIEKDTLYFVKRK